MASSASPKHYDAIVIGSGQAGGPLANAFITAGLKTALVERSHIGGCCVNEGCTPTKTMIASGRAAYLARRGKDYGIHTSPPPSHDESGSESSAEGKTKPNEVFVDMLKVRQRKRDIVDSFRGGNEKRLKAAGVDIMMGEASFIDSKTLKVKFNSDSTSTEEVITGEKIYVNVGERPAPPTLKGIEKINQSRVLDSTSIQELDHVPEHLVVIGGGYVGVEFAQLFRRLGAEVTILQRGKQLLPREDEDVTSTLFDILTEDGLKIHLNTSATEILPIYNEGIEVKYKTTTSTSDSGEEEQTLSASHILFAAGRIPNTEPLNLPSAGVTTNKRGYIESNEYLETSNPNVFVMGDVKGPPAFTHISYDDFRIIKANHLPPPTTSKETTAPQQEKLSTLARKSLTPYVAYTDPQLAHIGLHHHEAKSLYPSSNIKIAKMPMSYVARALETDESRGMMKAVIDADTGLVLGFTCLGIEGGEIMAVVQMAMMGGVRWEVLRDAVWAHPSLAESLNNLWGFLE